MLFSSMLFLWIFLAVVIVGYNILAALPIKDARTKMTLKNTFLLIASLVFYAWGGVYYLALMLASIGVNYLGGLLIHRNNGDKALRKFWLVMTVIVNLALLFFFKYFNMLVVIIEAIMEAPNGIGVVFDTMFSMQGTGALNAPQILLPIGISFFTFQAMSYVIDLYRGQAHVQKNIADFALYVSLFPQLIAGPIVRYTDVELQLKHRKETVSLFAAGQKRFCYGLAKKVLLANTFAKMADDIWALDTTTMGSGVAWLGILAYTLQIYYDFSGYSDMGIGLGRMFGFTFKENFNYPYTAVSIKDFWSRWHISLSTWFKEYVYIPLGGNRKGAGRTYINLFITWLLTGIWHGANFTFIAWGLFYVALLIIEKMFLGKLLQKNPVKLINWVYTTLAVMVAWVFFRAVNLGQAIDYLGQMFSFAGGEASVLSYLSMKNLLALVFGIALCGFVQRPLQKVYNGIKYRISVMTVDLMVQVALLVLCVLSLVSSSYNPFIYFQF